MRATHSGLSETAQIRAQALVAALKAANIRPTTLEAARRWEWSAATNQLKVMAESMHLRGKPFTDVQLELALKRAAIEDEWEALRVHTVHPFYEPLHADKKPGI